MAAEWICDGCGKREPAVMYGVPRDWHKPRKWFSRADEDGVQDACSPECIEKIAHLRQDEGKAPGW